jgi:septum formation protein
VLDFLLILPSLIYLSQHGPNIAPYKRSFSVVSAVPDLYLASQSPRRRELLAQIGVHHAPVSVAVPEAPAPGETPADYVQRLAREKARAGDTEIQRLGLPPRPVLGADTLVVCDQQILEKPRDANDAEAMLRLLSGRSHEVLTAVALCAGPRLEVAMAVTEVGFRALADAEIAAYWLTGEPRDKAGGYAIQGLGAVFVSAIFGSYSNVVGLPLETTLTLLQEFYVPWWQAGVQR